MFLNLFKSEVAVIIFFNNRNACAIESINGKIVSMDYAFYYIKTAKAYYDRHNER